MCSGHKCVLIVGTIVLAVGTMMAQADTKTWNASAGTGDWYAAANWVEGDVPAAGDDVVVTNIGALVNLTNSTAWLGSLEVSDATVSFSSWDATLCATNVTIRKSGMLTCGGPFANTSDVNRVNLVCSNLVIETGGAINVQGKGFSGGVNVTSVWTCGNGPGGWFFGGGYGGAGSGDAILMTGTVYGSATAPLAPGSGGAGGGQTNCMGGSGGGAVCITAAQVVVNGSINADASTYYAFGPPDDATDCSGGSGGGIYITCATIAGTNGTITAQGGDANSQGGGGGGGRIAVLYNAAAQSNMPLPSLTFSVASGYSPTYAIRGDIGTLYFPDNYFLSPTNLFNGQWMVPGFTNWSVLDLLVSNAWVRLPGAGFQLTVANTLAVTGTNSVQFKLDLAGAGVVNCGQCAISGAALILGNGNTSGPTLNCTGDLTLTNGGQFYVCGGLSNYYAPGYGALVSVTGDIRVASNCWIYPVAHPTNGMTPAFAVNNLFLDYGGGINADGLGYMGGAYPGDTAANNAYGPGATNYTGGSGYGGTGGAGSSSAGGATYGSADAPVDAGSGARADSLGDTGYGASGGGSVQICANDTVAIQGTISANGQSRTTNSCYGSGGGSGGSIYVICQTFIGYSNGVLRANGGDAYGYSPSLYGGGGGGGRIAIWRIFDESPGVIPTSVNGGSATNAGTAGNVIWGNLIWGPEPPEGANLTLASNGQALSAIVISTQAVCSAKFAAYELQWHLQQITGVQIPIVTETNTVSGVKILVGESSLTRSLGYTNSNFAVQEYAIQFYTNALLLMGRDATNTTPAVNYQDYTTFPGDYDLQGTCYAVYDFLERNCDVRWYWPGPLHIDCPTQAILTVSGENIRCSPPVKYRQFSGMHPQQIAADPAQARTTPPASLGPAIMLNQRDGTLYFRRIRSGGTAFTADHAYYGSQWQGYYTNHPTWFGVGYAPGTDAQPCMSNPDVISQIVKEACAYFDTGALPNGGQAAGDYYSVSPNDNCNWCCCSNCQAKLQADITGGYFNNNVASELVWGFVNAIAQQVALTHPNKFITCYAYHQYAYHPSFAVASNVAVQACLVQSRTWGLSGSQTSDVTVLNGWGANTDNTNRFITTYYYANYPQYYGYLGNFYCFPACYAQTLVEQLPWLIDSGVGGIFLDCYTWWLYYGDYRVWSKSEQVPAMAELPEFYLMYHGMLYGKSVDYDALLDEYFTRYYGNAAKPMQTLYEQIGQAFYGCQAWETEAVAWTNMGTAGRMASFSNLMAQAVAAAVTTQEVQRVDLFNRAVWQYMANGRNRYLYDQWVATNPAPLSLSVPMLAQVVTNGNPTNVVWTNAAVMSFFRKINGDPTDRQLSVSMAHDGVNLYFKLVETNYTGVLSNSYDITSGDCWQLQFARKRNSGSFLDFYVAPNGNAVHYISNLTNWYSMSNMGAQVVSQTNTAGQWTTLISLPLATMYPYGMKRSWALGVNFVRHGADGQYAVWNLMPNGLRNPSTFAYFRLY